MKLKNKKTGEILPIGNIIVENPKKIDCGELVKCSSLAELNEEWEDYEEPKEYWFLSGRGEVKCIEDENTVFDKDHKSIGNYFETREEAEKAVEKLKAWKRLKDKGFRFVRIDEQNEGHRVGQYIEFEMAYHFTPDAKQIGDDLNLLFGGEE